MKWIPFLTFSAVLLLLASCAPLQPVVQEPTPSSGNSAVIALLGTAHNQSSSGEFEAAGASLERALRIEPRNPHLWQELARIRFNQGQYREAENMAAKSNTLAAGDRYLRAENWRIIGQARTRLADYQGAQAAFERAEKEK
ncbi:MAG: tetratricopeptide repeat protein [Deltaproteobacteria bacterium]|nr:tetratricopeptide repeat protein [Deltaproteobacteria bacterium]